MQGLHNKWRTVLILISFGQTVVQVCDASVCAVFAIKNTTNIHDKTIIISNVRLFFLSCYCLKYFVQISWWTVQMTFANCGLVQLCEIIRILDNIVIILLLLYNYIIMISGKFNDSIIVTCFINCTLKKSYQHTQISLRTKARLYPKAIFFSI